MSRIFSVLSALIILIFQGREVRASEFSCPVPSQFKNYSCDGSVVVRMMSDLIAYKNNLGVKKGKAKNLIIDFDISTNDLSLSSPCKITLTKNHVVTTNGSCSKR